MEIQISRIHITDRIRKDNGDIDSLARSIEIHGLMNPITLMESNDGYVLIAGFRRLTAMIKLAREVIPANILAPVDAEEQLRLEIEENENRKEFTKSERVVYAKKLSAIEKEKGRMRMSEHARDGYSQGWDDRPTPGESKEARKKRTRDELANKVGFSSGKQLERATFLFDNRPDLMEQVDEGKKSIFGAYEEAKGIDRTKGKNKPSSVIALPPNMGTIHGMLGHLDSEFERPDGFPFVLDEVRTAAKYYLAEIRKAAGHYTNVMQSIDNSKAISSLLRDTFYEAADAFGENYFEEDENL